MKQAPVAAAVAQDAMPSAEEFVRAVFRTDAPGSLEANKKLGKAGFGLSHFNSIAETVRTYDNGDGIMRATVLGNTAPCENTEYPNGLAIHFSEDAVVDPVTLTPNSFQALVLCQINPRDGETIDYQALLGKLPQLGASVPQHSSAPIALSTRGGNNHDNDFWEAEMGDSGSVGVVRRRRGARAHDYFVFAKSGAEILGTDIIKDLAERNARGEPVKWGEFVTSKPVIYWKNAAMRNTCRLAYRVAEALGVAIDPKIESGEYIMQKDQAYRYTANPTYSQFSSSLSPAQLKGISTVAQYIQSAPAADSRGHHIVAVSPFAGFVGVDMPANCSPSHMAFPTTTGRATAPANLSASTISKQDAAYIRAQYTWEGKTENDFNDRTHPAAYRAFNDSFIGENFVAQGWSKDNERRDYDPVIVKIAARKVRA